MRVFSLSNLSISTDFRSGNLATFACRFQIASATDSQGQSKLWSSSFKIGISAARPAQAAGLERIRICPHLTSSCQCRANSVTDSGKLDQHKEIFISSPARAVRRCVRYSCPVPRAPKATIRLREDSTTLCQHPGRADKRPTRRLKYRKYWRPNEGLGLS